MCQLNYLCISIRYCPELYFSWKNCVVHSISLHLNISLNTRHTLVPLPHGNHWSHDLVNLDYEVIFQHLDNVKGSITIRKNFVMDIVKEAKRFKKKPLIEKLEEWAEQLESKKLSSPSLTPSANKKKDANNKMVTQRLSESGNNNNNGRESSWKR